MSIGSNGNQTNSSAFDFDIVSGLDGDDTLNSTHNGVIMMGGRGLDSLNTTYTVAAGAFGSQTQLGGRGDDTLNLTVDGAGATVNGVVDGGLNNDTINATFTTNFSGNAVVRAQATGGFGSDEIDFTTISNGGNLADVEMVIDAGTGNDLITNATAAAGVFNPVASLANARQFIDLGSGDDTIDLANLQSNSRGNNNVAQDIIGGAGADTFTINMFLASQQGGTGGTTTAAQLLDGGTGNDLMSGLMRSNFGNDELDNVTATHQMIGGNGFDTLSSTVDLLAFNNVDYTGTISGDRDSDLITVNHDLEATNAASEADLTNVIDLGTGNDTLLADIDVVAGDGIITNGINSARTTVEGGQGIDDITINSTVLTDRGAFTDHIINGGDNNDSIDSDVAAFVASTGSANPLNVADARAGITGGSGADTIDSFVQAQSSGDGSGGASFGVGAFARNTIDGGVGSDSITSGTFIFSDSNGGTGLAVVDILGGDQKDTIQSTMSSDFSELFEVEMDSDIDGGAANDIITSSIDGFARNIVTIDSDILGGSGTDVITSDIFAESFFSAVLTLTEDIDAGAGNDTVTATIQLESPAMTGTALGTILGGAGTDVIDATLRDLSGNVGHLGKWDIDGGAGNDVITVFGGGQTAGERNEISGGDDNDTLTGANDAADSLVGGNGDDLLIASTDGGFQDFLFGGTGADTFQFDLATNQGVQTIFDWEASADILQMVGLTDTNSNGSLVDEFDAATTIIDNGAGNNVDVVLAGAGRFIIFAGEGTGSVSSIADLMTDPGLQLIG